MESIASAPGKTILFGEHAVVYDEPAIAGAVNRRAIVKIKKTTNDLSIIKSNDLQFEAELDTKKKTYFLKKGKPGIIRYILESLSKVHDHSPIEIDLSLAIPIGSGLGSSAAVTVATLAALYQFHGKRFSKKFLAKQAHEVELEVQGIASRLDTSVSTYGGLLYFSKDKNLEKFKNNLDFSFVIGYTKKYGNTAKMVKSVKVLKSRYPRILNPILKTIGEITDEAKMAIVNNDQDRLAELMNINQGLLDSIGVNTTELSRMVYISRKFGAIGSKLTGAGGGGSIIAFCPGKENQVFRILNKYDNAIKVNFSREGVIYRNNR